MPPVAKLVGVHLKGGTHNLVRIKDNALDRSWMPSWVG